MAPTCGLMAEFRWRADDDGDVADDVGDDDVIFDCDVKVAVVVMIMA